MLSDPRAHSTHEFDTRSVLHMTIALDTENKTQSFMKLEQKTETERERSKCTAAVINPLVSLNIHTFKEK